MKKINKALASLCLGAVTMFTGVACDNDADKVVSAEMIAQSMATTIAKGSDIDTSTFKAQIKLKSGDVKTVNASELEFDKSSIDTSKVGEDQKLKVKYGDFEFEVTIRIVATESDVASIASLESQLLIDFNANKKEDTEDQGNDQNEFYQKDIAGNSIIENLKVGTDNPFNFRLNASGWDGAGKIVDGIQKVRTNVVLEIKNGDNFQVLDSDQITLYLDEDIDTENTVLDFSEEAEGKTFKVTVSAVNANEAVEENATKFDAILDVVDGYNVYNATDLSIYDNANIDNVWTSKKLATGMATTVNNNVEFKTTNAVILQDNISVTKDDIPSGYFWDKEIDGNKTEFTGRAEKVGGADVLHGTPKDTQKWGLYTRHLNDGDQFKFEGNYFTVDMSQFPKAVATDIEGTNPSQYVNVEEGQMMTSNLATFVNDFADDVTKEILTSDTDVHVRNIKFFGNSSLDPNNIEVNSGGIVLMRNMDVDLEAFNTIHHNFYIGYFTENGYGPHSGTFNINYSKGYNSFSTLFYCYGAENLVIKHSEFIDSGGPAIIANHGHIDNKDRNTGVPTQVDIVDSKIHSRVTGQEGWFKNYSADGLLKDLGVLDELLEGKFGGEDHPLLPDSGKTMYVDQVNGANRIDLVGLIMDTSGGGVVSGGNAVLPRGYIRIFADEAEYNAFYNPSEGSYAVNYGLDMDGINSLNSHANQEIYIEDAGNGGYLNSGLGTSNTDTSLPIDMGDAGKMPHGYKMTVVETILANGIAAYNADKPEPYQYANLPMANQKQVLQGIIKQLIAVPSAAGIEQLLTVYGAGRVAWNEGRTCVNIWNDYDALMIEIKTAATLGDLATAVTKANVLANALCSDIAKMTYEKLGIGDTAGERINLYLGEYGIGLTMGVSDRVKADD